MASKSVRVQPFIFFPVGLIFRVWPFKLTAARNESSLCVPRNDGVRKRRPCHPGGGSPALVQFVKINPGDLPLPSMESIRCIDIGLYEQRNQRVEATARSRPSPSGTLGQYIEGRIHLHHQRPRHARRRFRVPPPASMTRGRSSASPPWPAGPITPFCTATGR